MTITAAHVEAVLRRIPGAYGRQVASLDVLAAGANEALLTAPPGLTVQGAAAFLATMAQESASFRATEEYAKNGRYAPYIGRSFEMVTWLANYRTFGQWCKTQGLLTDSETFVKFPKSLANIRWAWLGGVWFWQKNSIWAYGNRGDFLATQRAVNLGNPRTTATPVGMTARNAWYQAWLKVGADLLPTPATPNTGRPIDMAATKNVWINYEGKQALKVGDNEVLINADKDKTFVFDESDGVDLLATIDVTDAAGNAVPTESFFRVVSFYKSGTSATPTVTTHSRKPTKTDQVSFKGSLTADKDPGRSARLRLVVNVPVAAMLNSVQVSGWML